MSSFNQRVVVSVFLCACSITGSAVAAAKGGISYQGKTVSISTKATGLNTRATTISRTVDSSDADETTTGNTTGAEVTTPTRTCNFSGFSQNDLVNNAYSGGTSANGVSQMNNAITFTGAKVLNTFWGSNEPNAGIVYSPNGRIVVGLKDFSANQISFAYTSSAVLTVSEFSSVDGTGTPLNSYTAVTTMPYGPYTVWTTFTTAVSANAKSIVISGTTDKWGMDQVVVLAGTDCNGNSVEDSTDIANGTSQDCNGNGIPDSCDFTSGFAKDCNVNGVPDSCDLLANGSPAPGAVQWRVEDGGNGHWYWSDRVSRTWSNAENAAQLQNAHLATSTSSAENEFLRTVIAQFNLDRPWIGGFQDTSSPDFTEPAGGWRWVTGETWNYTRWASIEPNNQGGAENWLHFGDNSGLWNDLPASSQWTSIMEWETTQALDCNGNGIPDSCDISSGNSRDVNLNGIPDECEAPATLTLTNNAGACNHAGGSVNVDATLSGVLSPIVSGQIYISWNPANMTLNSITAGDAPFNELPLNTINQAAGTALLVTSIPLGQPPASVISKVVARMHFTVLGGTCDGSGTDVQFFPDGTLPTEFTDGFGSKLVPALVASSGFKVDDTSPVFSNVPEAVSVNADAGEGAFARVALIAPTATDACGAVTQTSSRSDGAGMDAMYAVGTTTVTWSSTDLCGNSSTATTSVTVNNSNTGDFAVSYTNSGSYAASSARLLTLNIHGANGYTLKASQPVTLVNGAATISLTDLAVDTYDCVAIEEKGRSLRRVATVIDGGQIWNSTATLVAGDLINDEVVDVLDWGAYIVGNPNADLDGNGMINVNDGNIIIGNFGQQGETGCGTSFMSPPEPLSGISVAELVDRGLTDLVSADLNNDGWLDMEDVRLASNGGRMNKDGWWDVAVARSAD
jgi:hypothetical protein